MSIAHVWMAGRFPYRKEIYLILNPSKSHGLVLVGVGWPGNHGELLRGTRLYCPTFAGLLSLSLHRKARVITVLRLFYMKSNIAEKGRQE